LINEEKWTIKAAAKALGIKLCTAKYILYLYRKEGKIYKKKADAIPSTLTEPSSNESPNYVYVPFPVYILWNYPTEQQQMPINLVSSE
jgi:hypothetical protein